MSTADKLDAYIRNVPDFPKPGIQFKDITTLLKDPAALAMSIDAMAEKVASPVDIVVGTESRGFIFGVPLALKLNAGFVPVRKPGKLPAATEQESYELEYGTDSLEIHQDAIASSQKVLLVDDLLATGGTMAATVKLVEKLGGEVSQILFLIELGFLNGREKLPGHRIDAILTY